MLISVCQGTFNGAPAFLWRCSTNCKLHSDEGHGRLPFLLSMAFARSFAVAAIIATRCKWCAFSFVRCYCLRVCALVCAFALFEAVYLPFARLLLLLQYICPPCTLSRVYVDCIAAAFLAAYFVLPPFGESTTRRGKGGGTAGGQAPASVGAFYIARKASALFTFINIRLLKLSSSRCSFSASK